MDDHECGISQSMGLSCRSQPFSRLLEKNMKRIVQFGYGGVMAEYLIEHRAPGWTLLKVFVAYSARRLLLQLFQPQNVRKLWSIVSDKSAAIKTEKFRRTEERNCGSLSLGPVRQNEIHHREQIRCRCPRIADHILQDQLE